MKKPKNPVGRPPIANKASKSLSMVRVTEDQLSAYDEAADAEGETRSTWVRKTLDSAAKRVLKKRGRE